MIDESSKDKVRREPRASNVVLAARYRCLGDEVWSRGAIFDLSIGGALLSTRQALKAGERLELRLARSGGGPDLELVAEVMRTVERSDGPAAGVRFLQLTPEVAGYLAEVLNEALGDAAADVDKDVPTQGAAPEGVPSDPSTLEASRLSMIRLHDRSLYDLLGVDPSCPDGELESRCEALIASVARVRAEAKGARADRLRVLHNSLERLRPLWNDPIKRARYDLRWGFIRAAERLRAASTGAGVHAHILAAIWLDLYPDRVREAEAVMREARRSKEGQREALLDAVQLEPFSRRWREQLQALRQAEEATAAGSAEPPLATPEKTSVTKVSTLSRFITADVGDALDEPMPAPGAVIPSVRGSLTDLPLRGLLGSLAADADDAEVEVRVDGKQAGLVGMLRGDIVIASCGSLRGEDAVRALAALSHGTFLVRYCEPREELRHMRSSATELLTRVMATA